jgi:hypothetical protein
MIPSLNEKNSMYIPFYSSPHLLPIDYKQAWLWRENLFDDDNKKKRKIITKCTFNEDVGANCRVFYTKSTIGRDNSGEIDEWDVDEWNQFEEKKNWSYLNEFIVIHNSIIKTTNPFPHKLDVLPNCRLGCSGFYKNQKCKHIIGKKLC